MFTMISSIISAATVTQLVGAGAVVGLIAVSNPVPKIDTMPPTSTVRAKHFTQDHYRVFAHDMGE